MQIHLPIAIEHLGASDEFVPMEWRDRHARTAKLVLAHDGLVPPLFVFAAPSPTDPSSVIQGTLVLQRFFGDLTGKSIAVGIMRNVLDTFSAFAYLLISETWLAGPECSQEEIEQKGSLEHVAGRREAVMVLLETETSQTDAFWEILRDDDGTPRVGDALPRYGTSTSRFLGLLHQPIPAHAIN